MFVKKVVKFILLCLVCILVYSFFSVFAAPDATTTADNATITSVSSSQGTSGTASSTDLVPGTVYSINLTVGGITTKWAGVFGNITANITLKDANNKVFFNFGSATPQMVFLSKASSITFSNMRAASPTNIDSVWGYTGTGAIEKAVSIFTTTDVIGGITGVSSAKLYSNGASTGSPWNVGIFEANATPITEANPGGKTDYIFGVHANTSGQYYAGNIAAEFQIMVPVTGTSESYYFYVQIQ